MPGIVHGLQGAQSGGQNCGGMSQNVMSTAVGLGGGSDGRPPPPPHSSLLHMAGNCSSHLQNNL